ncbi:MAG: hypothetical protein EOL91_13240 [Actinobacteria bacterium]|nr:hypothetical protein [Actinomycetota bacterium]
MLGTIDLLQLSINEGLATSDGILINGSGAVVYGASFPMPDEAVMGWWVQFTSPGVVAAKIELEQSLERPTTEGSADGNYAVPDSITTEMFDSIDDELVHGTAYSPVVSKYGRLKVTGLTGNNSATLLSMAKLEIRRA